MKTSLLKNLQRGTSMIEVLVTIVILTFGLLGLVGLQSRLQVAEMESYQRAQAMILLDDMANRLLTNRQSAGNYVTSAPLGANAACLAAPANQQQTDASEWCNALQGAAEQSGASKLGTLIGGRGCVEDLGNNEYMVTVAWQGLLPIAAPPASVVCGKDQYDGAACTGDSCRRVVTTVVRIGTL